LAAGKLSAGSLPALAHDAGSLELCLQQRDRAKLGVALEDHPDSRRLGFADDQLPFPDVVAERHIAAHPHALGLRRGDLVANALAGDLALELGEREQHVFVARAPEEVVEENRERREDALSRMEKLAAALARLGGA